MAIHKNIAFRRNERAKHIARRKRICHHIDTHPLVPVEEHPGWYHSDFSRRVPMEWYEHDGQYDKGKIHCGCPLCKPGKAQGVPSEKEARAVREMELAEREELEDMLDTAV